MPTRVTICKGCCCGNVEKGNSEVPIDFLKESWKENDIGQQVKLTISGCLGPCSMNNVCLLTTVEGRIWLGELHEENHYAALVDWACKVAQNEEDTKLPEILISHRFEPKKTTTDLPIVDFNLENEQFLNNP